MIQLLFFATNDAVGADLCVCPETSTSAFRADTQVRPYSVIIMTSAEQEELGPGIHP